MLMVKFVDQCKEQEKSTSLDENGFTVAKYQLLEAPQLLDWGSHKADLSDDISLHVDGAKHADSILLWNTECVSLCRIAL